MKKPPQNNTKMKPQFITIFALMSFNFQFTTEEEFNSNGAGKNRRILHQPLFPEASAPQTQPPPPPPETLDSPDEDQPFINELPVGTPMTPYEDQQQPPPFPADGTAVVANPSASHLPSNPAKKLAVAVSSAILTLGMLMGMAFYLHKHRRSNSPDEAQKFFDGSPERIINHETRMLPPALAAAAPSSSYQKLSSASGFGPEFRPPPPASLLHSPPPMSSSDDESSQDNNFNHTPPNRPENRVSPSIPHSKRTSPKSRFSPSPPVKQSPSPVLSLGPLQPSRALKYSPKRAKFSPPRGSERRLSTTNDEPPTANMPIPQPPPPPPLGQTKHWAAKTSCRPMQRIQSKSPSPTYEKRTRPMEDVNRNGPRPKMKPLHWDKVGGSLDTPTVWDRLKTSSFQLNEDAMESLFGRNSPNFVPKQANRKLTVPPFKHENRILDSKKSQNIAILLRALNVTREEVCEALLDGNPEGLGPELFETLVKMAPSKEEEIRLKKCYDRSSNMGPAERFLRAMLDIPFAFQRVEALLYRANFKAEVEYLRKSFKTLEEASEELKNSHLFLKLLEAVLRTGNRMNDGTNRGSAKAFKLDTLLKLVDVKGTDGKTTLLHFVVQEIIRSEQIRNPILNHEDDIDFKGQSLRIVSGLGKELANVKKAASMDSDVLSGYVSKLETGMNKIREVMQLENPSFMDEGRFFDSMRGFLREAGDEIARVRAEERKALSLVKEVTCYFHGDAEKGDTRALRIFVIVRDFLGVLDNVCKDVGRIMHDRVAGGGGRPFRISATASLPVLGRYNVGKDGSSDDDSM